jgi:hypothetical protein
MKEGGAGSRFRSSTSHGADGFPRTAGAFGLSCRVDVEHDPRHLGPIGSIAFCVEEA